ncbi:ankyrin repeat domain-containing protein [Candidatus Babeliales bacterium]|nr:ankyrin repeat domain-containing protein [Candidatus Babeliales bacterium]
MQKQKKICRLLSVVFLIFVACFASVDGAAPGYDQTKLYILFESIEMNYAQAFTTLLEQHVDVNGQLFTGTTPLHYAGRFGRVAMCQALINAGAEVNKQNLCGETPLHEAASSGSFSCCKLLLHYHALVDLVNNEGKTPLALAMQRGTNQNICELLVRNGAMSMRKKCGSIEQVVDCSFVYKLTK